MRRYKYEAKVREPGGKKTGVSGIVEGETVKHCVWSALEAIHERGEYVSKSLEMVTVAAEVT